MGQLGHEGSRAARTRGTDPLYPGVKTGSALLEGTLEMFLTCSPAGLLLQITGQRRPTNSRRAFTRVHLQGCI